MQWLYFYSSQQVTELSRFKELPDEVPLPLVIGTKVTGLQFIIILNNNNNSNNNDNNNFFFGIVIIIMTIIILITMIIIKTRS